MCPFCYNFTQSTKCLTTHMKGLNLLFIYYYIMYLCILCIILNKNKGRSKYTELKDRPNIWY